MKKRLIGVGRDADLRKICDLLYSIRDAIRFCGYGGFIEKTEKKHLRAIDLILKKLGHQKSHRHATR
jgi:hypothetical protein